jgi:very-short-patch-repair endonuclease
MDPPQRNFARRMRKQPTIAERKLWWHLRHRLPLIDTHFRRQVQIGPYIADFASHQAKLVIEIDGGQHGAQLSQDETRSLRLASDGYRVLRFWNNDVLSNIEGVLVEIQSAIASSPPPQPHPPTGRGEVSSALPPRAGGGE